MIYDLMYSDLYGLVVESFPCCGAAVKTKLGFLSQSRLHSFKHVICIMLEVHYCQNLLDKGVQQNCIGNEVVVSDAKCISAVGMNNFLYRIPVYWIIIW